MKTLVTTLIIFISLQLSATDKDFFRRQAESAHPTPSPSAVKEFNKYQFKIPYKIQGESKFFNIAPSVDEGNSQGQPTQNESSIAVNPNNPNIVISSAVDYRDNSSSWVYVSIDGGRTWENKNLGKANGWRSSNDPSVMFDKDGTGYLVHGAFPANGSGENGVYLNKSTDGGITWSDHIAVIEHKLPDDPLTYFEDKYYIEVDNSDESPYRGHLYIPWKRVTAADSATQIVLAKSTDKGETWLEPVNISERLSGSSEDTTFGQSFPLVSTGPEGNVYAVWNHGIKHAVGFNKSTDGGITWGTPGIIHQYNIFGTTKLLSQGWRHTVKGKVRAEAYPVIKTDYSNGPNRGNVYVVWAADSIPNIYFSKSTDEGETWSEPKIVHAETKGDQFWTWMGVDPTNGDLAVMYLDSRNDPDNIMVECFVSYSSDGGETWIDRQISDVPSDIRNNPFDGNVFAGDYSGLDFYDGVIFPSWVDMRNTVGPDGNINDNDVYSAIIRVDQPSPVNDLTVSIIPNDPTKLNLSWTTVLESSFGKQLQKEDFNLQLFRDDVLIKTLSPEDEVFTDTGLTPYQRYDYKIRAKSENDSSIYRYAYSYAGGTEKPDSVFITNIETYVDNGDHVSTRLFVKIPDKRADKVTPLTKVKRLEIFGDGEFLRIFPLVNEEIGTTVAVNITQELGNFSNLSCVLVAGYENQGLGEQFSDTSNSVLGYEGELIGLNADREINFDDNNGIYYSQEWEVTDEIAASPTNSISTSPNGNYKPRSEYTLYLQPTKIDILTIGNGDILSHKLTFDQICEVHPLDSAVIESSNDLKNWTIVKQYSSDDYEQWKDNNLTQEDWINTEAIPVTIGGAEIVYTRFRLVTNAVVNKNGWYLDNLEFSPHTIKSSVEEDIVSELGVYPNPTSNYLNIVNKDNLPLEVELLDLNGNIVLRNTEYFGKSLNLTNLFSGVYILKLNYKNHSKIEKITIIK
ncbi:MAG: T9SS type A sorting domain-containing protein [Candidatus Kapaibacterium sp.]